MGTKYYPFGTLNIEVVKNTPTVVIASTRIVKFLPQITLVSAHEVNTCDFKMYGETLAEFLHSNIAGGQWDYFILTCNKLDKEDKE